MEDQKKNKNKKLPKITRRVGEEPRRDSKVWTFPTALLPFSVGSVEGERKVTGNQGGQERDRDRNRDWDSPRELEWGVLAWLLFKR